MKCLNPFLFQEYKYVGGSHGVPKNLIKEEKPLLVTSEVALLDPADK